MKKYLIIVLTALAFCACDNFLNQDVPQGVLTGDEVNDPQYIDNICISAYAIFISSEDVNSSFSMWNYDVRSDDAYKGGISENWRSRKASSLPTGISTTCGYVSITV